MLTSKKLSSKINYDALNDLFVRHGGGQLAITGGGEEPSPRPSAAPAAGGSAARPAARPGGPHRAAAKPCAPRCYMTEWQELGEDVRWRRLGPGAMSREAEAGIPSSCCRVPVGEMASSQTLRLACHRASQLGDGGQRHGGAGEEAEGGARHGGAPGGACCPGQGLTLPPGLSRTSRGGALFWSPVARWN